jgi:DNA-binding GntR family transcriptional regulator
MSPATVRRAIKDLRKANLIETKQRYRDVVQVTLSKAPY